jgi:2-keto-4-pentenoate hydratase
VVRQTDAMSTSYADGFAQQLALLRVRLDAGMPRLGWKVGINVPEVQRRLGLAHSVVGWLDGHRAFLSGATVIISPESRVHVEPELCLRVGASVSATADRAAALAAVDAIAPALELVDYAKPATNLTDVVRGSMFHSGCVLGDWRTPRDRLDIASGVSLHVDSLASEPARSDLVPDDLADLVLLVATLLAEGGQELLPGDRILSGSFTAKALPLRAGQIATAELGDFGFVSCAGAV